MSDPMSSVVCIDAMVPLPDGDERWHTMVHFAGHLGSGRLKTSHRGAAKTTRPGATTIWSTLDFCWSGVTYL